MWWREVTETVDFKVLEETEVRKTWEDVKSWQKTLTPIQIEQDRKAAILKKGDIFTVEFEITQTSGNSVTVMWYNDMLYNWDQIEIVESGDDTVEYKIKRGNEYIDERERPILRLLFVQRFQLCTNMDQILKPELS